MGRNFSYTKSTAEAASVRRNYNPVWGYGVFGETTVEDANDKEERGDMASPNYKMIVTTWKPLRDPEDPTSTVGGGIKKWLCIGVEPSHWQEAFDAGELPEEDLLKWRSNLAMFLRQNHGMLVACGLGDVPNVPVYTPDEGWVFKGETLDVPEGLTAPERDEFLRPYRQEAYDAAGEFLDKTLLANPKMLEGCMCFGKIKYEKGNDRPTVDNFRGTEPYSKGKPVGVAYTSEELMGGAPAAQPAAAPAKGAKAKPAPKRGRK